MASPPPPPPPAVINLPTGESTDPIPATLATASEFTSPPPPPSSSSLSLSPSLLIIAALLAFVFVASVSIHLLLRFLARPSSSSSSSTSSPPTASPPTPETVEQQQSKSAALAEAEILIESLPLFTMASSLASIPKSSPDCAVCLSPFSPDAELRLLPACCHAFHADCIGAWLRSSPSCPLCRAAITLPHPPLPEASRSFRVEIGSISSRRVGSGDHHNQSSRRSYSLGSFDYFVEDEVEAVVSRDAVRQRKEEKNNSVAAEERVVGPGDEVAADVAGGSSRGWLRDYVDRLASSASSSFGSRRFSGRWSARWGSRRVDDVTGAREPREDGRWDSEAAMATATAREEEETGLVQLYRWIVGS